MSRELPQLTVATIVRGMSTAIEETYEEFLANTDLPDFSFRIHMKKRPEGDEFFIIGVFIRGKNPPGRTIDFPNWIKLE